MAAQTLYPYRPSVGLACVGAIVFVAVAGALTVRTVQHRTWILLLFLLGAYLESAGLVSRAYSSTHLADIGSFLMTYFTTIIAPSFLAAGCYIVFERIVWFVTPPGSLTVRTLWIHPRWVTRIFVSLDLLSFGIQFLGICSLGASYKDAGPDSSAQATSGARTIRLGLILQLLCFATFGVVAIRFIAVARPWMAQRAWTVPESTRAVQRLVWALVSSSTLLTLRAVYRVVEFSTTASRGSPSYLPSHEWPYWLLDATPTAAVCLILAIVHPGAVLPAPFVRLRLDRQMGARFKLRLLEDNPVIAPGGRCSARLDYVPSYPVIIMPLPAVVKSTSGESVYLPGQRVDLAEQHTR